MTAQIRPKKYVSGWFWSATNGSVSLNSNPAALFATQEEAEADARAVIARSGQLHQGQRCNRHCLAVPGARPLAVS